MTQEDKELILKDISGRLPYNQIVQISLFRNDGIKGDIELDPHVTENIWEIIDKYHALPYLRPMSSMTEEEKHYIDNRWGADNYGDIITYSSYEGGMSTVELADIIGFQDWLNANHFDYRGLIEKGLALEAPEGMYN